jgi:hypothetical protein
LGFQPRREFFTALFLRLLWGAELSTRTIVATLSLSPRFAASMFSGRVNLENEPVKKLLGSTSIFRGDSETHCAV